MEPNVRLSTTSAHIKGRNRVILGFADDTVLVAVSHSIEELEIVANETLRKIVGKIITSKRVNLFANKCKWTPPPQKKN